MAARVSTWIKVPQGTITGMYVLDCAVCGIVFGITTEYEKRRRADGNIFYCPNGHSQSWHESEADRLRKQLESTAGNLAFWRGEFSRESKAHSLTKGKLTRTRNRIQNGVCPNCNRHFANLERHMASKHGEAG